MLNHDNETIADEYSIANIFNNFFLMLAPIKQIAYMTPHLSLWVYENWNREFNISGNRLTRGITASD